MSHEIRNSDHMFSAIETPWHGLGTVTTDTLTLDQALITAQLDWTVSKHPAFTRDRDMAYADALPALLTAHADDPTLSLAGLLAAIGFDLPIADAFATVRDDIRLPLATVGSNYTVHQNAETFELARVLMDGGDVKAETAGSLRDSRTVWLLARLDRDMTVGGDEHVPYLLFTSSHDGTSKLKVVPTMVRVVCNNTLRMALANVQSEWTARHTASIGSRVQEARETLGLAWRYADAFEDEVKRLQDETVTDLRFESIVLAAEPDPTPGTDGKVSERSKTNAANRRGDLRKAWERSPEVGQFRGTAWGAVQAFSTVDLWAGRVNGGEQNRLTRQAQRVLKGDTMANTTRVIDLIGATA
jgi:phage/plasmid-like protein (TIGR03299 family)